jgi:hypothetical protein
MFHGWTATPGSTAHHTVWTRISAVFLLPLLMPSRHFGDLAQDLLRARLLPEELEPEGQRIDLLGRGHLVDHALDAEFGVAGADGPPEAHVLAVVLTDVFDVVRRDLVVELQSLRHRAVLAAALLEGGREHAREDRLGHDAMAPAHDVALRIKPHLDVLRLQRPVLVVLDVVFAAPDDLDRPPLD